MSSGRAKIATYDWFVLDPASCWLLGQSFGGVAVAAFSVPCVRVTTAAFRGAAAASTLFWDRTKM